MTKNVTLRMDEAILRKCRHAAVDEDKSLSQWIADQLVKAVSAKEAYQETRKKALKRLEKGFDLGGTPLSRDEVYER